MNEHNTPRVMTMGELRFGDRFRYNGDVEGTCYATVYRVQDYADFYVSVDLIDGTSHYGPCPKLVVLLHRAPYCECGRHVDYCEADCEWPAELEELWQSLYRPAAS